MVVSSLREWVAKINSRANLGCHLNSIQLKFIKSNELTFGSVKWNNDVAKSSSS